jgi:hypothetical protein
MASYGARRNLVEAASAFELAGETLTRAEGGAAKQQLRLGDVRRVRITYQPVGPVAAWICWVEAPHGRVWIPSASYTGFGRAQDQRADFRGFVQTLSAAIAAQPHAQPVAFLRGGGWQRPFYLGALIVFAVLAVLLVMGLIGSLIGGQSPYWVFLPTLVILFAAQMSWRLWRGNPPGTFDPNALPPDVAGG